VEGVLLPIALLQLELRDFRDPEPTAQHHQNQRPVHGRGELRKEPLDRLPRERFGEGASPPDQVTGLDGVPSHPLRGQAKVTKVLQRMEAAVEGRPDAPLRMLVFHKLLHLTGRELGERHAALGKKQAEIHRVTRHGVGGELAPFQVRPKPVASPLAEIVHGLPPVEPLLRFALGQRVVVLGAFGPVIELRIPERHVERAVAHALFDHRQRGPRIAELGGKRMPQRRGRLALRDPRQLQLARPAVADLPRTERQAALASHRTRDDRACRRDLELMPLPQGRRDVGGQIDHAIHLPLTVVDAQGARGPIERRPVSVAPCADSEPASQPSEKHRAVLQDINHPKERDALGCRPRRGEPRGHEKLMARELHRRLRQDSLGTQEEKKALQPAAARADSPWRERLREGGRAPGVNIRGRGLGQVLIEESLTGLGPQHRKTFEGAEGAVLR
jgi:hypothetical protein